MKRRIITLILVLALAASIMPAALAMPGMNYIVDDNDSEAGKEFTVEIVGRNTTDELFWVGEEITLQSYWTKGISASNLGERTEVWMISYTDKIEDCAIIAAAGNEDTYTFSQDVEGVFYYFHGAVREDLTTGEVYLTYSNPIRIETIPPKEAEEEPDTQPEEENPEQEQPEEVPYIFPFTDVAESAWYYNDVFSANKLGLIDGKNDAQFCPDDTMTVAEAIKLAACLNQLYTDGEVTLRNGTAAWYDTYVAYALEKGIIDGAYEDYNAAITRKEFVHIFHAAMPESEYAAKNEVADGSIADVAMDSEYADEIYTLYRAGILTGGSNGEFMGESTIKRSEVAAILTRMYDAEARK